MTENRLDNVIFSIVKIANVVRGLDPNEAHGQYKISIGLQKICDFSNCMLSEIIYKGCLNLGLFQLV